MKQQGFDVGIMKPVQCGGDDTKFLLKGLSIKDPISEVNPFFAKDPLSPHSAFKRQSIVFDKKKVIKNLEKLRDHHDMLLVEGAGGLMVPITEQYFMSDLIRDLDLPVIIVARLGIGTINHTLMTIRQAQEDGLTIKGVVFCESQKGSSGIPEKTNPQIIGRLGNVPVLGIIPYLDKIDQQEVLRRCKPRMRLYHLEQDKISDKTELLTKWDKEYIWHPFTQMEEWLGEEPLVIDSACGSYLKDTKGNRYIDGVSSLWVNLHGHGHKIIDQQIKKQINKLSHSTMLGLSNTPAVKLAKKLVDITPKGLEKVFYSDNGSTAVEIAIKMAYQYWQNKGKTQKTQIVHLANSYHGDTLGSVSVGGIDLFHEVYKKLIFKTIKVDFPDCYRAPKGKQYPKYVFECVDKMEAMFEKSNGTIAALVVEPLVQGCRRNDSVA